MSQINTADADAIADTTQGTVPTVHIGQDTIMTDAGMRHVLDLSRIPIGTRVSGTEGVELGSFYGEDQRSPGDILVLPTGNTAGNYRTVSRQNIVDLDPATNTLNVALTLAEFEEIPQHGGV